MFVFYSCKTKNSINKNVINFDSAMSKNIELNEISDSIRVTFLITDNKNLLGEIFKFKCTRNYIFIVDQQQKLFIFKKNGELYSVIYQMGKGPSEYIEIVDFYVDREEKFILILDPLNGKLLTFDINGIFISGHKIEYNHAEHITGIKGNNYCIYQSARFSLNNQNLFFLDSSFNTISSIEDTNGDFIKNLPYLIDINWYNFNGQSYFKYAMNDTIFAINNDFSKNAHYILNYGSKRMPNKYYTKTKYYQTESHKFYLEGDILESNKYIFIPIYYENKRKHFLFNKKDNTLFDIGTDEILVDSNFNLEFWPTYIDMDDVMYQFIPAGVLYDRIKTKEGFDNIKQRLITNNDYVLLSSKLHN